MNSAYQQMIRTLVQTLRANTNHSILLLTRTVPEMIQAAKFADSVVGRSPYFVRMAYEGEDRYLFSVLVESPAQVEAGDEPSDLWIAAIEECTPMSWYSFSEAHGNPDFVMWPTMQGVYGLVPYETWADVWAPWEDGATEVAGSAEPFYRPEQIASATVPGPFDVGLPIGWVPPEPPQPPTPPMSVWDHLLRNVGKEVTDMAAKKKAAKAKAKPKAKAKAKTKTAKKPHV
jgi:hypothetical protein